MSFLHFLDISWDIYLWAVKSNSTGTLVIKLLLFIEFKIACKLRIFVFKIKLETKRFRQMQFLQFIFQ